MRVMKKRAALAMTLGITGAMASKAVAQYTISNTVTASTYSPLVATDDSGVSVSYGTLAVGGGSLPPIEQNGGYPSAIIGTVTGTLSVGNSVQSAYEFDASYGFRLLGENNSKTSAGGQTSSATGVNIAGQVMGTSGRASTSSTSTTVLGTDGWISTTTGGTLNNATVYTTIVGIGTTAALNFNASGTFTGSSTAGTEYSYNSGGVTGTYMSTSPSLIDSVGDVVGTNLRYEGDITTSPSTSAGQAAWYQPFGGTSTNTNLSGMEIGLINNPGNYYNLTPTLTGTASLSAGQGTTTMAYYSNSVKAANAAGYIIGTTIAYTGPTVSTGTGNTSLGNDAWEYSGAGAGTVGTITEIGGLNFMGLPTTTINSTNSGTNYSATVAEATVTDSTGNPFTTTYGGSTPTTFTYGYIPTSGALGTFSGAAAAEVQVHRATSLQTLNDSGQVGLAATYYINNTSSSGQDAYVYTPTSATTGTYAQVGLTAGSYPSQEPQSSVSAGSASFVNTTGVRSSQIIALNDSGQVAGYSTVYFGAGANYLNTGSASWYASPNANFTAYNTVQIGLYNTGTLNPANESALTNVHVSQTSTYSGLGVYADNPALMNKYGEVAGTSYRYNSVGNQTMGADGWLYDPRNGGTTFVIDAAAEETNTYVQMNLQYLSDTGVVVGQISTGAGTTSTGSTGFSAFVWSEANPSVLVPLTTDTTGLSTAGFKNIANSYFSDLTGYNLLTSALSTNANTGATVDSLIALTPEPGSLSILGIGAVAMLGRRRHRSPGPVAALAAGN